MTMELWRDPQVTSRGSLALGFQQWDVAVGNMLVGASGSIFGSIKPVVGSVHYTLQCTGVLRGRVQRHHGEAGRLLQQLPRVILVHIFIK